MYKQNYHYTKNYQKAFVGTKACQIYQKSDKKFLKNVSKENDKKY